ncbi:hypothetical protein BGX38DRAFT_1274619 [Terfezia claveryi]|nr:hypothetical protein BGX38DRAFT_1274619 [Terfezia claveryi]
MAQSTTDITALVSICGVVIGPTQKLTEERRLTPDENDYDSAYSGRIPRILDAFASISLNTKKKGQVIAVALQITPAEIQLIMTGNRDIEPEVVSYLQSIWEKLQAISKLQFDHTEAGCDPTTTSPTTITPSPPRIPNPRHYERITELTRNLAEEVLMFCFPRLQAWFDKFWPGVDEFAVEFIKNPLAKETEGDNLVELLEHLGSIYNLIKSVPAAQTKKEQRARKTKIGLVVPEIRMHLKVAMRWTPKFLSVEGQLTLDRLEAVILDRPGLNLIRSIDKMTTLQRQIETLVGFAYSQKLALALQERQFGIQVLPAVMSAPPDWPCTLAEWEKMMLMFIEQHELHPCKDRVAEDARAMADGLSGNTLRVHAECRLVAELVRRRERIAISYIGVSKLSCQACTAWLSTLRSVYGCRFTTRGSHRKWYPGWDLPEMPTDEFDKVSNLHAIFKSKIEEAYLDYIQRQGRGTGAEEAKRSDSTGASGYGQVDETQGAVGTVKVTYHLRSGPE